MPSRRTTEIREPELPPAARSGRCAPPDIASLLRDTARACQQLRTPREFLSVVERACRRIGEHWGVSAVALYEMSREPGAAALVPRHVWRAADAGQVETPPFLPIPASWPATWRHGEHAACTTARGDGGERVFLAQVGAASALALPVLVMDAVWGALLLTDTHADRVWEPGDIAVLQALVSMFGGALTRQRLEHEVRARDASLRTGEARYLALANHRPSLVCRFTPDFVLTFANDEYCRFYQASREALIGQSLADLLPDAELAALREAVGLLTPGAPAHQYERRVRAPGGASYWYQWSDRAIFDDAGHILEYQSVGWDVTEPRYVEDQLREREERYHAIVSNVAVGICLVDMYGQFLECNPAFVRMTGSPPEELVGLTLSQVTYAQDWHVEQPLLARLWDGEAGSYSLEKRLVTREGATTWAQAVTAVIRDGAGEPQYAVQVLEDITARKDAERVRAEYQEQLRALALKATINEERERRRIAQNLHDQIGQSLAIARIQLGKLAADLPKDDLRRRGEAEDIRGLLSDALDYSRTVTCELSPPILHELGLVPALKWLVRHFSERYHLPTELEVSEPFPGLPTQLRVVLYHIIRELLVNIVKHAEASQAIIHLMRRDGAAIVSVEDDGRGMQSAVEDGEPSGGFGLFSVRERVEQLGGTFAIESSPQRGTRCVLRVPVAGAQREDEQGWT